MDLSGFRWRWRSASANPWVSWSGELPRFCCIVPCLGAIILTKLLSGTGLLLACTALPIVIYGGWAAIPGTHAGPFEWWMTASRGAAVADDAARLSRCVRQRHPPRAWFGSRLLPLVTVVLPAFVLQFALLGPLGPLIGLPAIFVLTAVMISNILLEAETRDF